MKSLDKKEALKIIQTRLDDGKPRIEILEELLKMYDDKSSISKLIAMTPNRKIKEKYKLLNYTLLFFLVLSFILQIPDVILLFSKNPVQTIVVGFIVILIYIYCIFQVSKFRGYIYSELFIIAILGAFNSLLKINSSGETFELNIWTILNISVVLVFVGLAFYLSKKMFPNYGLWRLKKDKLKKDKNGDYLLE
jgi:hypothetical protein